MTKEQMLGMIKLLSALESWAFSKGATLPDYLSDNLSETLSELSKEILK